MILVTFSAHEQYTGLMAEKNEESGPIKNQMVEAWNLWMMASVWKIKIMHVNFFMLKINWDFFFVIL